MSLLQPAVDKMAPVAEPPKRLDWAALRKQSQEVQSTKFSGMFETFRIQSGTFVFRHASKPEPESSCLLYACYDHCVWTIPVCK